jgi:hypothetical protein
MGGPQTHYSAGFFLPQAKAWADQAGAMGEANTESAALHINGGNIWPFASAVAAYNSVCTQFTTWSGQGVNQMFAICDALCTAAKQYGATEQQLIQASDGTWDCRP